MDWMTHEEDVWFEFRGSEPDQLTSGRYYKGTVDGFADFGVFVDLAPGVTGLLHRSELDQRLESLDWDPGDTVFVQVKNVRDNGNIDLAWSIRQSESEFRGARIDDPEGDADGEPIEGGTEAGTDEGPVRHRPEPQDPSDSDAGGPDDAGDRGARDGRGARDDRGDATDGGAVPAAAGGAGTARGGASATDADADAEADA
ncbi:MAG: S1 RNA-binding domain-containing protein, partial [Haloferacaceae archaeon]